jgi:hypothetical protein
MNAFRPAAVNRVRHRTLKFLNWRNNMPEKTTKKRPRASMNSSPKSNRGQAADEQNIAVYGVYPDVVQTRSGVKALKEAGFPRTEISTSAVSSSRIPPSLGVHVLEHETRADVEDSLGQAARMTGCLLGLGILPFLAPMLVAAPVLAVISAGAGEILHAPNRHPIRFAGTTVTDGVMVTVNCGNLRAAARATKALDTTGAQNLAISAPAS